MTWWIITSASLKICIFMKEIVLSGIRATGQLHLGNYYGALNKFVRMQDDYNCYFFIADLHALTTHPDPTILHANVKSILSEYLAAGIDPDKATIFVQSDVPEIPEMYLLMNMHVGIGELMRTASFKDKARKQLGIKTDNDNDDIEREIIGNNSNKRVNAGLLTYPTLMAVDILIHHATKVPVGKTRSNTSNSLAALRAVSTQCMALSISKNRKTSTSVARLSRCRDSTARARWANRKATASIFSTTRRLCARR